MESPSRLELASLHRRGGISEGGGRVTERFSTDFVVDDHRLSALVNRDVASCLGWGDRAWQDQVVKKLLLRGEPDFLPNRYALYVCPECGDLGCGALSAVVERDGEFVVWRDFAWANNYEEMVDRGGFEHLGPFRFEFIAYERLLLGTS
jgi:hypothetical protein